MFLFLFLLGFSFGFGVRCGFDYEQVRAYFANTLLLAREKVADGATENVLPDEFLAQANRMMQKQEAADCVRFCSGDYQYR